MAKTKVQCFSSSTSSPSITVDGQHVECVATSSATLAAHRTLLVDADPTYSVKSRYCILINEFSLVCVGPGQSVAAYKAPYLQYLYHARSFSTDLRRGPLLSADTSSLQAFHMRCQRRILDIKWQDQVCNSTISETTGLSHQGLLSPPTFGIKSGADFPPSPQILQSWKQNYSFIALIYYRVL